MRESVNLFDGKIYSSITLEALSKDLTHWYFQYQTIWIIVLLTPAIVTFILSIIVLSFLFVPALYLKAYRYYYKINGYTFTPTCWETPRSVLAYLWDVQAAFWYGYEIEGLQNIPDNGAALIVFYHGAMPVDFFSLIAKTIIHKHRLICAVGDRFLFKLPAFDDAIECFQIYPGTIDTCADILKKGNLLAIAPGGAREALFADDMYPLMWETRKGFAKVAMEAKVPIIPVFTENIREAFFTLKFTKKWLRGVYERTRIPLVPIYGGFPVKLKTIVGKPVQYDPEITSEEMAVKVADQMRDMIKRHQQLPGSIPRSVAQRINHFFKAKS